MEECSFDAAIRIMNYWQDTPGVEAERRSAKAHLETCAVCQRKADRFFEEYQRDPEELHLPPGANNIWELFELAVEVTRRDQQFRSEVDRELLNKFLGSPDSTRNLVRLLRQYQRLLSLISLKSPQVLISQEVEMMGRLLIDLKIQVGEETLAKILSRSRGGLDRAMETLNRLGARQE